MKRLTGYYIIFTVLLLMSAFFHGCGECEKDIYFFGTVTDKNYNPLGGVDVYFFTLKSATTGSDGNYSFTFSEFGSEEEHFTFVKTGYAPYEAPPFTVAEVGHAFCGAVKVERDAILE